MARSRTGTRSNSVAAAMAAHVAVREPPIEPPRPLPERAMPLWLAVIESRARHEWQRLDLHLAAELCASSTTLTSKRRSCGGKD